MTRKREVVTNRVDTIRSFIEEGYMIIDLFDEEMLNAIAKLIHNRIDFLLRKNSSAAYPDWILKDYHKTIGADNAVHNRLMERSVRYIILSNDLLAPIFQKPINSLMDHYWGHRHPLITHLTPGSSDEVKTKNECGFRVARPELEDVTGIHVDVYKDVFTQSGDEAYESGLLSRLRTDPGETDLITVWIPIVGFSQKYSLRFAPGSHTTKHPIDIFTTSSKFMTRECTSDYESRFHFIRPELLPGQAIVFHPNLLHGGSVNEGNSTRVSIEVRLRNNRLAVEKSSKGKNKKENHRNPREKDQEAVGSE